MNFIYRGTATPDVLTSSASRYDYRDEIVRTMQWWHTMQRISDAGGDAMGMPEFLIRMMNQAFAEPVEAAKQQSGRSEKQQMLALPAHVGVLAVSRFVAGKVEEAEGLVVGGGTVTGLVLDESRFFGLLTRDPEVIQSDDGIGFDPQLDRLQPGISILLPRWLARRVLSPESPKASANGWYQDGESGDLFAELTWRAQPDTTRESRELDASALAGMSAIRPQLLPPHMPAAASSSN